MEQVRSVGKLNPDPRDQTREYIFDMIREMAKLARQSGDRYVAIHLEAIIAARRAAAEDRSL